jgi:hypothetical protein
MTQKLKPLQIFQGPQNHTKLCSILPQLLKFGWIQILGVPELASTGFS